MGLDDFKTESSSSSNQSNTASPGNNGNSTGAKTSAKGETETSQVDPYEPYFTAAVKDEYESVETFKGKAAFPRSGRFRNETVLCVVETEEKFHRLNQAAEEYAGDTLKQLFKKDKEKALDIVERFGEEGQKLQTVTCPVCGGHLNMREETYTKAYGEIVHAHHKVKKVVDELAED